jgi:uncharacterized protein with NRDE domain
MCLIATAVRASANYPIIIAANRDELYDRPTRPLHLWDDDQNIAGGRDLRAGGSWLAITREGRFAAVTNIRGIDVPNPRSRGELVGGFVRSTLNPLDYAQQIQPQKHAGFHLITGDRARVAHVASDVPAGLLPDGIFAVSNARASIGWPKIALAREAMAAAIHAPHDQLIDDLMRFLTTRRGGPIEEEVFVSLPDHGYGTRSSTLIVMTENEITIREMTHPTGEVITLNGRRKEKWSGANK